MPNSLALSNTLHCRHNLLLAHHHLPWLLLTAVALLVAVAMVAPIIITVVAAPLMVDPQTPTPGTPAVARLGHSAKYASKLGIRPTIVGTALKKIMSPNNALSRLLLPQAQINPMYTESKATDHITGDLDRLMMHEPYTGTDQIHTTNGSGVDITHIGNSIIPTTAQPLTLNHVLHVPSAHKNLISVHRFTLDNDIFIEFHPFFFLIKDRRTRKVLLRGLCKGGLYPLPPSTSKFHKLVFHAVKISVDRSRSPFLRHCSSCH
jgi:hypothetical protein